MALKLGWRLNYKVCQFKNGSLSKRGGRFGMETTLSFFAGTD